MSGVEQPEGGTNEARDAEAGAVPNNAAMAEGSAADLTYGDELSTLQSKRKSTGDMSLDLAAALDEPEQLVRHLIMAANEHIGFSENEAKWKVVLGHAAAAAKELEKLNEPRRRD